MRAQINILNNSGVPRQLLERNPTRTLLLIRNFDPVNWLFVQSGPPGSTSDFWPIEPGELLTLDPTKANQEVIADQWWGYYGAALSANYTYGLLAG